MHVGDLDIPFTEEATLHVNPSSREFARYCDRQLAIACEIYIGLNEFKRTVIEIDLISKQLGPKSPHHFGCFNQAEILGKRRWRYALCQGAHSKEVGCHN